MEKTKISTLSGLLDFVIAIYRAMPGEISRDEAEKAIAKAFLEYKDSFSKDFKKVLDSFTEAK